MWFLDQNLSLLQFDGVDNVDQCSFFSNLCDLGGLAIMPKRTLAKFG
jgi:hypothetical protein